MKRFEENTNQNSMGKDLPDVFDDVETKEKEYDNNKDGQEEVDENVEENNNENDESSIESDEENDERPWEKLRRDVIHVIERVKTANLALSWPVFLDSRTFRKFLRWVTDLKIRTTKFSEIILP